jgi:3-dehydroquinate dehydratase-2
MDRVDIIHGVNLNLLGKRETEIYGYITLEEINAQCKDIGQKNDMHIHTYQSNIEGEIVNYIQDIIDKTSGIIINPGAFTHYSIAIRDALLCISKPIIEVHMSNIFAREDFRKKSILSDIVYGIIIGFGEYSYYMALSHIKNMM